VPPKIESFLSDTAHGSVNNRKSALDNNRSIKFRPAVVQLVRTNANAKPMTTPYPRMQASLLPSPLDTCGTPMVDVEAKRPV
jgi:hypothetical protein